MIQPITFTNNRRDEMRIKYEQVAFVDVPKSGMFMDIQIAEFGTWSSAEQNILSTVDEIKDFNHDVMDEPKMYEDGLKNFLSEVIGTLATEDFDGVVCFRSGW